MRTGNKQYQQAEGAAELLPPIMDNDYQSSTFLADDNSLFIIQLKLLTFHWFTYIIVAEVHQRKHFMFIKSCQKDQAFGHTIK